jgi:hypothetical protein
VRATAPPRAGAEPASEGEPLSRVRVLKALRHLTDDLAPDDAGVRQLLGQLDALYMEITDDAAEAVRSVLAEAGARALLVELTVPSSPNPENAQAGADAAQVGNGGSVALEPLPTRKRVCPECGHSLRQDGRQAKKRVFCSVRCRVRHHRAQAGSGTGTRPSAQPQAARPAFQGGTHLMEKRHPMNESRPHE